MHRSGTHRLVTSAAVVIVAFLLAALLARPKQTTGPCEITMRAVLRDVPEASGLAVGRRRPGVIWTHNDSGNAAVLFAIDASSGVVRGRVRVPAQLRDWEALSSARCDAARRGAGPADECLFLGDIGDNGRSRPSIQLLVVPEPDPAATDTERPEVYVVAYPDGAHNAEAMFVAGGRLLIITRDRVGTLYESVAPIGRTRAITLRRVTDLGLEAVTDAAASPDEAAVAVRTPREVRIYRTADLLAGSVQPRMTIDIAGVREPQGEGAALGGAGMLYLASEGGWLSRAGFTALRCDVRL